MTNIVIPMAGLGSRFVEAGYLKPKPFIDVVGQPMIQRVMQNLRVSDARFILIGRREHLEAESALVSALRSSFDAIFVPIESVTEGAACTVLFARKYIESEEPLLIANSDQIVDIDFDAFVKDQLGKGLDGSILTFDEPSMSKKWSYARVDPRGFVVEVREKVPISSEATVGVYLFSSGRKFITAAIEMIIRNERVNNEFYVCPVYNHAIRLGAKIGTFRVQQQQMHGIGTPEDLTRYVSDYLK